MRKMGPLKADHPLVLDGTPCPACTLAFKPGDFVTLVALGPGNNPVTQRLAREGRAYTGVAAPVHWACATGEIET